jgi:flavorubredoxin
VLRYPEAKIVCNEKIDAPCWASSSTFDMSTRAHIVNEGDTLSTGRHNFTFVMAPWCTGPRS